MENYFIFLLLLIVCSCADESARRSDLTDIKYVQEGWSLIDEKQHNQNRNDATTYSEKIWVADQALVGRKSNNLMTNGVYPVPSYELIDSSFNG